MNSAGPHSQQKLFQHVLQVLRPQFLSRNTVAKRHPPLCNTLSVGRSRLRNASQRTSYVIRRYISLNVSYGRAFYVMRGKERGAFRNGFVYAEEMSADKVTQIAIGEKAILR